MARRVPWQTKVRALDQEPGERSSAAASPASPASPLPASCGGPPGQHWAWGAGEAAALGGPCLCLGSGTGFLWLPFESPQAGWLTTPAVNSLRLPEAGSLDPVSGQVCLLPEPPRGKTPLPLPAAGRCWPSLACSGLTLISVPKVILLPLPCCSLRNLSMGKIVTAKSLVSEHLGDVG